MRSETIRTEPFHESPTPKKVTYIPNVLHTNKVTPMSKCYQH